MNKKRMNSKISVYMKKKREKRLMTRGAVVEATGLNINTIKNIENPKYTGGQNMATLKLLCDCYGTTLAKMCKFLKL